jgi:hypothetical protein
LAKALVWTKDPHLSTNERIEAASCCPKKKAKNGPHGFGMQSEFNPKT